MTQIPQSWDTLGEALMSISYERDPLPKGSPRFRFVRDDNNNYAVLFIFTYNVDTYDKPNMRHTRHEFVVPVTTYNYPAWVRWVFDCIMKIETHETTEWFFVDGKRVYAPHHGNGWDPYAFWPGHDVTEKSKSPGDD